MSKETLVSDGNFGAVAAEALAAGDILAVDSNGKLAKAGAAALYAMVCMKATASGDRGSVVMGAGKQVYAQVKGDTDVAVGDHLECDAGGVLIKRSAATAVAVALEARTAAGADQVLVLLL